MLTKIFTYSNHLHKAIVHHYVVLVYRQWQLVPLIFLISVAGLLAADYWFATAIPGRNLDRNAPYMEWRGSFSHENGMCWSVWWFCSVLGKHYQNSDVCSLAYKGNIRCFFFQKVVMKILFPGLLWALWGQYGIIPISNSKQIIQWPSPLSLTVA